MGIVTISILFGKATLYIMPLMLKKARASGPYKPRRSIHYLDLAPRSFLKIGGWRAIVTMHSKVMKVGIGPQNCLTHNLPGLPKE